LELSRSTDEQVGDGTTSVIVLSAEVLSVAERFLRNKLHPIQIVRAYNQALQVSLKLLEDMSISIDVHKDKELMEKLVTTTLSTKFSSRWNSIMVDMAIQAVGIVKDLDLKRYAKMEKIPGGELSDCQVLELSITFSFCKNGFCCGIRINTSRP